MKFSKMLAAACAATMAMSCMAVPAMAADEQDGQQASTKLTCTVTGSYTITVPQTVAMTGEAGTGEKSATIDVTLKGDIAENQRVVVETTAPIMTNTRESSLKKTATVTAPKMVWTRSDLLANSGEGTKSEYVVKATLTPGDWAGTAIFNCSLGYPPQ